MDKYFYFRTQATIGDDDDAAQSLMVPVSKLRGILPSNSGTDGAAADELTLFFESTNNMAGSGQNGEIIIQDSVLLNITIGKSLQVIKSRLLWYILLSKSITSTIPLMCGPALEHSAKALAISITL